MNLHAVVRSAIISLHPDETVILRQSVGQPRRVPRMGRHAPLRPAPSGKFRQVPPIPARSLRSRVKKPAPPTPPACPPAGKYAHIPMKIHHFPLLEQCLLL